MKTDSIFYRLFQSYPAAFFELLGQPNETAQDYEFCSVEVKQLAFRIDGVFSSNAPNLPNYFVEVQFQEDPRFYNRTITEIFLYLGQNASDREWQFVVLFAKRSIAPALPIAYQLLAPNIHLVYLDELQNLETQTFGVKIVDLVVCKPKEVEQKVPLLLSEAKTLPDISLRVTMLDLIETILVYKFENLSRKELEAMFGLSELKQTRVYQEAKEEGVQLGRQEGVQLGRLEGVQLGRQEGVQLGRLEGVQLGRQEGVQLGRLEGLQIGKQSEAKLLIRMLSKRFGILSKRLQSKIMALPLEKMEDLGEMLLDFAAIAELETWLESHK